jgi:hypothetical protein
VSEGFCRLEDVVSDSCGFSKCVEEEPHMTSAKWIVCRYDVGADHEHVTF